MAPSRFNQERALFEDALSRPAGERKAWLRGACAGDEGLLSRVERLLRQAVGEAPTPNLAVAAVVVRTDPAEQPGAMIGSYELVELLGEGGFGTVYLAEQHEPVRRRVALKIIKLGMDTGQVIARFEIERQVLAIMDHPGIARVIDAGATDSGRPYFVMDLVHGVPVTEYCAAESLSTDQRLRLFIRICAAVQHAHQKSIIHRDLKPSNVLVASGDDGPVPRIIDFGIAKATESVTTPRAVHTRAQELIGTPQYMSPEQATMGPVDVDTRSDIYALGVMLYELLAGTTPFDRDRLSTPNLSEMQRLITETLPPRPSSHVPALRGDLDRIVMKAIEKEPAQRYQTADGLAEDIRRFLAHEPILAVPPGAWYRARKFASRNRTAVVAATLVVFALVAGATLATIGFVHARRDRDVATERLRESFIAQARASRSSPRIGRREEALNVLAQAAAIRPSRVLRDEVIACLTLDDVVPDVVLGGGGGEVASARGLRSIDRVALTTGESSVRVLRVADASLILEIPDPGAEPRVLTFSSEGRYLAIKYHTDADVRLHVWDIERGERVMALDGGAFRYDGMAFAPDGTWLALSQSDGNVHIYGLPEGEWERSMDVEGDSWFLAAHPDGVRLAIAPLAPERPVLVVDVRTGTPVLTIDAAMQIRGLAWSPDGMILAGACADRNIYFWDAANGAIQRLLTGHQGDAVRVFFDRSGRTLASFGWDTTVRLWDVATGVPIIEPMPETDVIGFGERVATLDRGSGAVTLWRLDPSGAFRRIHASTALGPAVQLDVDPTEQWLLTAGGAGVHLFDARGLVEERRLSDEVARSALFSPRTGGIVAVLHESGVVRWPAHGKGDAMRPEILWPRTGLGRACLSSDGRRMMICADAEIVVFDLDQKRVVQIIDAERPLGTPPSRSTDGRWLATGTWRGRAGQVWDLDRGARVHEFEGSKVQCTFAPSGALLAVGTPEEHCFHEWTTWALRFRHDRTASAPTAAAFAFDDRLVAVADARNVLVLIDTRSGVVVATLASPDGKSVTELRATADPPRIIAPTPDREIHVWELAIIREHLAAFGLDW